MMGMISDLRALQTHYGTLLLWENKILKKRNEKKLVNEWNEGEGSSFTREYVVVFSSILRYER